MLTEIYCDVDDFCKSHREFIAKLFRLTGLYKKLHSSQLTLSEVMTIVIYYHLSPYKTFKDYYTRHGLINLRRDFPDAVCYDRFVALLPRTLLPLVLYLGHRCRQSLRTGIYFIDSTRLEACDTHRVHQHRVLKGFASWGKTSMGWFYGLKLHLIVNNLGQIIHVRLTDGSTHDSDAKVLFYLTNDLFGWVFGDKGYLLSPEKQAFVEHAGRVFFAAKPRQNMVPVDLPLGAKRWAKKRGVVETVIGQTKQVCDLEHTRHRSAVNAFVNIYASLVAYSFYERKPKVGIELSDRLLSVGQVEWALAA
jgi:hypothetical protein